MADRIARLALYKQLLKAAADFPSIRRKDIIKEIKIAFRSAKTEKDSAKINSYLDEAQRALKELSRYKHTKGSNPAIRFDMYQNP